MPKTLNPTKTTKEVWEQDGKAYHSLQEAADAWLAQQLLSGTNLKDQASRQTFLWQLTVAFTSLGSNLPPILQQYLDTVAK